MSNKDIIYNTMCVCVCVCVCVSIIRRSGWSSVSIAITRVTDT